MSIKDQLSRLFRKPAPAVPPVAEDVTADSTQQAGERTVAAESEQLSSADFAESRSPYAADADIEVAPAEDALTLPVLGTRSAAEHQRLLVALLAVMLVILAIVTVVAFRQANTVATQVAATGNALMQSQRLAKSVSQALVGNPVAFPEIREAREVLAKTVRGLKDGNDELGLKPVTGEVSAEVEKIVPMVDRAEKNADVILKQEKVLTQVGSALRTINRQSSDLLEIAETI
ncbi:type IV pili methyl-accepting chemotaxis transducer N-terminal domain-containing protein, partial [Tibeticola sp.]|uniref:type IV pili methyl-accepting chemotaxis transducer N-terminal domain-containing protein n=1 Tax=Tibeticola sp. TaxID=2005368 RepID=UPI00258A977D